MFGLKTKQAEEQQSERTVDLVVPPNTQCDRCVAKAKHRVDVRTGNLFFCTHHLNHHAAVLRDSSTIRSSAE